MIGAEITRKRVPRGHAIEHAAQRQTVHSANVDSKSDDAPGEVFHHDQDPVRRVLAKHRRPGPGGGGPSSMAAIASL